jgi:mono/diheme cytochrome c family protein
MINFSQSRRAGQRWFLVAAATFTSACSGPQPLHIAVQEDDEQAYLTMLADDEAISPREAFLRDRARTAGQSIEQAIAADELLSTTKNPFRAKKDSRAVSRGAVIYKYNCMRCHGADVDGRGPDMTEPLPEMDFHRFATRFAVTIHGGAPSRWFRVIRDGLTSEHLGADGQPLIMQPFARELSQEQIWLVVTYLQSLDAYAQDRQ